MYPDEVRASDGGPWDPVCQAGSSSLLRYLMTKFGLANSGCRNPTSLLSSGAPSWHVYGKAIDLGCWWFHPDDKPDGDACWHWLIQHREELWLQQAIWGNRIFDVSYGERNYYRSDHYNHIHVALGAGPARNWRPPTAAPDAPGTPLYETGDTGMLFLFQDERDNAIYLKDTASALPPERLDSGSQVAECQALLQARNLRADVPKLSGGLADKLIRQPALDVDQ